MRLACVLDLDTIVFGGPAWPVLRDVFLEVVPPDLRDLTRLRSVDDVEVRSTTRKDEAAAIGAASLAMVESTSAHRRPNAYP